MWRRSVVVWTTCLALALVVAACGGDDDEVSAANDADGVGADEAEDEPATDDAGDSNNSDGDTTAGGEAEGANGDDSTDGEAEGAEGDVDPEQGDEPSGGVPGCDEIFSLAEIEDWFGEPAEVTEEFIGSIGQLLCTWETIEDPDDLDDLAFQLIVAQLFTGDPAPAAPFVDPEFYDDITVLDGIGDLAFSADVVGLTFNFLDEPMAGSFSYSDVDVGNPDAAKRHTAEETEALFREFHQRVTG